MNIFTRCYHAKTVAVAMSGGIDSAATAVLLKAQGFDLVGVFMRNWDVTDENIDTNCTYNADRDDMQQVCKRLGIAHYEVDFVKEYWSDVFTPFLDFYRSGIRTPNPDVLCNRFVKFDHLKRFVSDQLGLKTLATGHYCRLAQRENLPPLLLKGVDDTKDQSYFLSLVNGRNLADILMPLGDYHKYQVREMVAESLKGLNVLKKKESMGICFIGKRSMPAFLSNYIPLRRGRLIDLDTGEVVGSHQGIETLTIGQGANISGCKDRYFVAKKSLSASANGREMEADVYVVKGRHHPALFSSSVRLPWQRFNWLAGSPPESLLTASSMQCSYRMRNTEPTRPCSISLVPLDDGDEQREDLDDESYHSMLFPGRIRQSKIFENDQQREREDEGLGERSRRLGFALQVNFPVPQRAVTPGQVLVLYDGDVCLGGGIV